MEFNPKPFSIPNQPKADTPPQATETVQVSEEVTSNQPTSTPVAQESYSLQQQLEMQQQALAKIYQSVEKTRKYFLYSMIATLVTFVLPLIIFLFALPKIIDTYTSAL